jgi:hypothetical protein
LCVPAHCQKFRAHNKVRDALNIHRRGSET